MSGEGSVWRFYVVVVQNNGKEMYKKKRAARAKLFFLLIRPIVFLFVCFFFCFTVFVTVASLHDFIFCLNKLQILTRASLLALAKSKYYI